MKLQLKMSASKHTSDAGCLRASTHTHTHRKSRFERNSLLLKTFAVLVLSSILMGGGIVWGQQSPVANGGFLFPHDSCVFQTDTFYGNYTIDYFFVSNSTNFELSVLENYSLIHNIVIEKMLIYNSNDSLIDQISINLSTFTKSFSVPTIGDTFKIQLQVVSPLNIYDFDICLNKQLWFTLYHCLYNFSGTTNCDVCGADGLNDNGTPFFFDDDVEYGICEMTNCGPDSMKFSLNANWSDPNYRFEWYFHGVNGNAAYIDQISAQPKYRYYSTVGYDTVDVLFFNHNFATYPFKAWVQLIIKTIEAPVVTATVQPTPTCPSCNNGYQDSVIFDYNAYGFYECTSHWLYWHNGIPLPAGVGQPPYVAKYNFTGVDSVTIWWENACGTDTLTLPVYISNQPYFTFDTVCVGSPTNLYAQTNCPLNTFTAYEWDFGNGNTASGPVVNYTFPNSGTFPVQLTITDDCGNTESYTNDVYVRDLPVFEAELDYFTNCSTDTIHGSIINPVPYYTYTWHVSPIGALNFLYGNNGANVVMVTNNSLLTIPTYIIIQATDVNGGCKSSDTLLFFPCCTDSSTVIYLSDTTLTSYNSFGQIPIMINGEVTFDADQDFTGTNIWFGPMAKINVSPGVNTSFTKCALSAGCDYMWQGIELIDNTTTIEVSGSKILDAINFVVSNDGAYYNIHDNDAVKNNNCVLSVINAPAGFTGVFSNNNISCDAGSMWPPYNGKYAFCGVETNQSQNIMIGPGNTFKGLLNGIWSESSQIIVKDNTFKNINITQIGQFSKAAIYINSGFSDINTPLLISYVGGMNPADGNLFQNCLNGVVAEYQQQLQVENNEFKSIHNYGVKYSWFHQFSTMLIANNSFTNTAVGVYAYLNLKMPSYIESNTFTWNGNPLTATGIQVLGTKYKWEEFYITNNTISKAKTGISINTANNCYIENNTIENLRNNSGPFKSYGIRMVNCFIPQISSNIITPSNYNPNQPAASSNFNTGIQIENCWAPTVTCNTIRKVGTALHVSGVNTASTIWDNDFIKSYRGISITNGGSLGIQGRINRPSDNQWINNSTASGSGQCVDDGTAIQSVLYVRTNPYSYNPTIQGNYYKIYCSNTLPIFGCPVAIIDDPSPLKFSITNELPQQSTESKGWNKKGLSKIIRQHPNWATNDTILSEFIDSMTLKPAVLFDSVLTKREEGLIIEARAINNSIIPELDMDDIEIEVNNYYLTLESGQSISAYENRIREIAEMCPFTEGEGVYKARILMEMFDPFNTVYFNECEDERAGKSMEFAQNIEPDFNVTVFPNPATDAITIEIQSVESNFELIVYDHTGKEVLKTELYDLISMIDLKQLEVGFYSYIIISSSGQVSTGKFSILAH